MRIPACAGLLFAALILLPPLPALPGAWTRAAGEGQIIVTAARSSGPAGSVLSDVPDRDITTSQIYLEYGLTDSLTLGGKAYVQISGFSPGDNSALAGGFLRKRVWQDGQGGVASLEGGYAHPIESVFGPTFANAAWGAVPEAHGAALYGRGWGGDWGSAFLSTGLAYYWRGRGAADNLRAEATAGYAPWRWLMGMVSLYGLEPLGSGSERSLKVAPSLAFSYGFGDEDGDPEAKKRHPSTIQFGASYDLLNPGEGVGFSVSVWRGF